MNNAAVDERVRNQLGQPGIWYRIYCFRGCCRVLTFRAQARGFLAALGWRFHGEGFHAPMQSRRSCLALVVVANGSRASVHTIAAESFKPRLQTSTLQTKSVDRELQYTLHEEHGLDLTRGWPKPNPLDGLPFGTNSLIIISTLSIASTFPAPNTHHITQCLLAFTKPRSLKHRSHGSFISPNSEP